MEYQFTAFMQTKGLYKSLLGKEVLPPKIAPLAEDATNEQRNAWQTIVDQRAQKVSELNERNNSVWCHIALALDKTSLMYIRHDCMHPDGTGDGAKAWRSLQQRYSNVEKPTVVSLVRQLSRLQLGEGEKLHEYFIRSQELTSRLNEAGEEISETLFNALVINGLPEQYEHFIVQESFNPAATFTELRTRLQNYEDSRAQRKQDEENNAKLALHSAPHSPTREGRKNSSTQSKLCYVCGNPGHFVSKCYKRATATCSICKKKGHLAKACKNAKERPQRKDGSEPLSSYSSCFVNPLSDEKANHIIIDTGCTDHIVYQREVFENLHPCNEKNVRDPKGSLSAVEGIGDVPITVQLKNEKKTKLCLRDVLYVPSYKVNLLSVDKAVSFGHQFIFHENEARMILNDGREINLIKDGGLFFQKVTYQQQLNSITSNETKQVNGDTNLGNKRRGHLNKADVKRTIGCVGDLDGVCETCAKGKQASKPVPKEVENKATNSWPF